MNIFSMKYSIIFYDDYLTSNELLEHFYLLNFLRLHLIAIAFCTDIPLAGTSRIPFSVGYG